MQTRRNWIRSSIGLGGLLLAPELALSKEEIRKFNPRPLSKTIKLSSNENPYGPSEKVQKAVIKAFENGCRYPRVYSSALADKLAKLHGVSSENIIITGGSTGRFKNNWFDLCEWWWRNYCCETNIFSYDGFCRTMGSKN